MKHFADLLLNKNNSKSNDQVPFIQRRRGIEIKSAREINLMKKSSRIVGTVLREINDLIKPGLSTKDLDTFAEKRIREMGAVPSFKGYHGFPSSICSSINNEVVHGIPNKNKIIKEGDVVKIDTGAYLDGFHGDSCITICVGEVSDKAKKLSDVALQALFAGLSKIKSGNTLLDIAGAIEGDATTPANADVNKAVGGDSLIIFDTSATTLKRVSASGLGGGKFLGETSGGAGDIIRVHENELNTSVAIDANNNGLAAGPLTIASGVTLTINGELSVV